jgi:hypothetical protein
MALRINTRFRPNSGQGLIEGACGLIIVVTAAVLLTMFGMNIYATQVADGKLRLVALEAAKVRDQYQFFLGMLRQDYKPESADANAKQFAASLAKANGVPLDPNDDVAFASQVLGQVHVTTCQITLKSLKLPFGGVVFPDFLKRTVSITVAGMALPPPLVMDVNTVTQGGSSVCVRLPAYAGFGVKNVDVNSTNTAIIGGSSIQKYGGLPMPGPMAIPSYIGLVLPYDSSHYTEPITNSSFYSPGSYTPQTVTNVDTGQSISAPPTPPPFPYFPISP